MTKTSLADGFSLSSLQQIIVDSGVLVLSIRPPTAQAKGWAVNFRQRDKELLWHLGPTKPTLEDAVMDALEKIERLLENRTISHVAFGRTTAPGSKRFATINDNDRGVYRGAGDTVSEAVDNAMAATEAALSGKKATPKPKAISAQAKPTDPLEDLLG